MTTDDAFQSTPWPLTGSIWTQRAGETDLLFGSAEARRPAACHPQEGGYGYAYINILVDGEFFGSGSIGFYEGSGGRSDRVGFSFYPTAAILAPESDTPHVVTARVYDSCLAAGENFTFKSFRLDVIGAS